MKSKIAVAVAALCVTGFVHADTAVTLSGKLGFAYQSSKAFGTGEKTNGLGVPDGDLRVTAAEDLGAGLKVTAYAEFLNRGRDQANTGRDAAITLSGDFGSVMVGSIDSYNAIIDLASAGAPTLGLDNNTLDAGLTGLMGDSGVNILRYTSPEFSGASLYIAAIDSTATGGMQSTSAKNDAVQVGVNYTLGSLTVNADYVDVGANNTGVDAKRYAVSGMYDFGAFALGAGYQRYKEVGTAANKQYELGVSAPVTAALTVGATYGHQAQDGTATIKGYELGANYALSKRTGVRVAYRHEKADGGIAGTDYQIRLMHSF